MPRVFLPAVTAKNNALLAGDTQPSADFEIQPSDDDDGSSTAEESMSPDLLRPAFHQRKQPQQQQQKAKVTGESAAVADVLSTGNKRARVHDRRRSDEGKRQAYTSIDNQQQADPTQEDDTFSVVFVTVALGITLAAPPSSDADGTLVVCDMDTTPNTCADATSKICIGDRLIAVGDTSAAGLSVDRVQRLIVRGSRPLQMTFRRRRSSPDGGATAAKKKQRPLGGLERPSRDCLLDTISNIATHEDSLLPDSQPQWPEYQDTTQARMVAGVSSGGRSENGHLGDGLSRPRNNTAARPSRSLLQPTPPLQSSFTPGRRHTPDGNACDGRPERKPVLNQPVKPSPSAQASPSPTVSSSLPVTEVGLLTPGATSEETQAALLKAATSSNTLPASPPPHRENGRAETPTPDVQETLEDIRAPQAQAALTNVVPPAEPEPSARTPAQTSGGRGSLAGTAEEGKPKRPKSANKKKRKKDGGGALGAATSAGVSSTQGIGNGRGLNTAVDANNNGSDKAGLARSLSSGGGKCGSIIGTGRQVTPQASSSTEDATALVPTAAEVSRILAKLGARGVSELALYKNLTFDELVKICRYTGGIDLSKRLPKATMAERLNFLCVEQGALTQELQAAAGAEARAETGEGLTRMAQSPREAEHLNVGALSTPALEVAAPSRSFGPVTLPSNMHAEPPSVQFAASPPTLRRPSHAHGNVRAIPRNLRPSSLLSTPLTASTTTTLHQQLPLSSPRGSNPSSRGRNVLPSSLPTSTPPTTSQEERGGGKVGSVEDDQHCWEDWNFLDSAGGCGRSGAPGREKGGHREGGGVDEEAAWWSQEPDHRDWSPCSSPTADPATAVAAPRSRSYPASSTSAGEPSWDGEGGDGGARRRNPLLPPTMSSSAGQGKQGSIAQSLWSGRFPGQGLGFASLPKWILRSVRSVGTQVRIANCAEAPG